MALLFPPTYKRLVVIDGCNGVGLESAAALAASPLAATLERIVLLSASPPGRNEEEDAVVVSRGLDEIERTASSSTEGAATSLRSKLRIAGQGPDTYLFDPAFECNTATDVYVYVARSTTNAAAHSKFLSDALSSCASSSSVSSATRGGVLIVLAASDTFPHVASFMKRHQSEQQQQQGLLHNWKVVVVRALFLSPPSQQQSYPRFHDEFSGPLENLCLGVALGVTKQLRVNAGQPTGLVPLDIALNVGFISMIFLLSRRVPSSFSAQNVLTVCVGSMQESAVVWGMIGEYIIDYYGRYKTEISRVVPAALFSADPVLDFNVHFPDLWNYGISLTTPMQAYRRFASQSQRTHLQRFPHSTMAERVKSLLTSVDVALERIQQQSSTSISSSSSKRIQQMMQQAASTVGANTNIASGNSSTSPVEPFDNRLYLTLLRQLARERSLVPYLAHVSLEWVQWEMYVKRVCVGVLQFASQYVLNSTKPLLLPHPTHAFHNDFVFAGPDRAPEPNFVLRQVFPDLHFALRAGQQPNGDQLLLVAGGGEQPRLAILAQPHIQLLISQLAREQQVSKTAVQERADAVLRGIGDTLNNKTLRSLGYSVRVVFKQLYTRLNVNDEAYDRLFRAFHTPRTAVVIIPTHRSYVDFLVLSYMMLSMGFPLPHICSGEDFLRLGGVAELMRGSGAFFMRRSFKSDKLYGALFKEYVRQLVRGGKCIEFFIEGMRSRTGKTLSPKLGILKFITDAFFEKQDEISDILFVPVSLSYERLLEANIYADELMGTPKPKETLSNLLKSASILRANYGSLNVIVGEPLSLRSFSSPSKGAAASATPSQQHQRQAGSTATASVGGGTGSYTPYDTLVKLAWRITFDLQKNIVVTPTGLLSAVLQCTVDAAQLTRGCPLAVIASNVEWVRSAVLKRGGRMNAQFAACDGVKLTTLAVSHLQPRIRISPLSSHVFLDASESDGGAHLLQTTHMVLSIYSNQLIHLFVDEGVVMLAASVFGTAQEFDKKRDDMSSLSVTNAAAENSELPQQHLQQYVIELGLLREKVKVIRGLLSTEFPNYATSGSPTVLDVWLKSALQALHDENRSLLKLPLTDEDSEILYFRKSAFSSLVLNLLYPYTESAFVVLLAMAASTQQQQQQSQNQQQSNNKIDEAHFLRLAHEGSLQLLQANEVHIAAASSKENLRNAMSHFVSCGLFSTESTPTVLFGLAAKTDAELQRYIELVNSLRWRSSLRENIQVSIDALRKLLASFSTAKPKL